MTKAELPTFVTVLVHHMSIAALCVGQFVTDYRKLKKCVSGAIFGRVHENLLDGLEVEKCDLWMHAHAHTQMKVS
jgi:hypothetical protein